MKMILGEIVLWDACPMPGPENGHFLTLSNAPVSQYEAPAIPDAGAFRICFEHDTASRRVRPAAMPCLCDTDGRGTGL